MLVDSHCHLDFPDFSDDLDGIVARAAAAGIGRRGCGVSARC
jgi:TatD DNase family protein